MDWVVRTTTFLLLLNALPLTPTGVGAGGALPEELSLRRVVWSLAASAAVAEEKLPRDDEPVAAVVDDAVMGSAEEACDRDAATTQQRVAAATSEVLQVPPPPAALATRLGAAAAQRCLLEERAAAATLAEGAHEPGDSPKIQYSEVEVTGYLTHVSRFLTVACCMMLQVCRMLDEAHALCIGVAVAVDSED